MKKIILYYLCQNWNVIKFIIINILALFFFQFVTVPSSMIVHGRFVPVENLQ